MKSSVLIFPPDIKAGCLPRKFEQGEVCPMLADRIKVIPEGEWAELLRKRAEAGVANRSHIHDILNQRSIGSCAAEAANGSGMAGRSFSGQAHITMSPWFTYYTTSGGRDGGSSIDANLRELRDTGAVPMELWDRSHSFREKPPKHLYEDIAPKYRVDEFYDIQNTTEFGTALLLGMFPPFGWSGHSCFGVDLSDRKTFFGWLASCSPETLASVPYYVAVQEHMRNGGDENALAKWYFVYANSWDESWGDNGFGMLPLNSVNWNYGAWALRSVTDAGEEL